jgi:hypothetical protein
MTLNAGKYICSAHRERGTCRNNKIIAARTIEHRVLEGVRAKLLSPDAIAQAICDFRDSVEAERREALARRLPMEREVQEIERKLSRVKEMYVNALIEMTS